ncbi:hypothetical protein [Nostoc sp. FACHB-888]|uniref:hypothetical protein n=1 Tax=Nostoc sp. FACHB-888 TaxID=2692842 RepID=UPI0016835FCB|nr:hypothetical protein [Nostoc sp. FACHB-888]MBD2248958.1 hypothetical protein [Nostoc sp. FACHB-888]
MKCILKTTLLTFLTDSHKLIELWLLNFLRSHFKTCWNSAVEGIAIGTLTTEQAIAHITQFALPEC